MSAFQPTAYLLVSHGSRDPRPQAAMNRIAHLVRKDLEQRSPPRPSRSAPRRMPQDDVETYPTGPQPSAENAPRPLPLLVGTACLELGILPLSQQIIDFSQRAQAAGMKRIRIVPLFLLKGVHVMDDIPAQVELARQQIGEQLSLEVCPHLGSHPGIKQLIRRRIRDAAADAWLLLSHGSRRPRGNHAVEKLAQELGAETAFWSVPPHLEHQVIQMMQSGHQRLTILPYFLFTGGITDALTRVTEELAERFPKITIRLLPPLGATQEMALLVSDLAMYGANRGSVTTLPMSLTALRY
ncbi:cobalamin biosynthesis protein CbiX [filamentous cyanobacterium CCP5]|nr:cobalamin biosynthesis protein CbiX [filamentous cyanobacterium CCP5]